MPIWKPENISITPEDVLRGQGVDPEIVRGRRPVLFEYAERAIEMAEPYMDGVTLYDIGAVKELRHEKLFLEDGRTFSGELVAQHLGSAEKVVVMVTTAGKAIGDFAGRMMAKEPVLGLALDGVGSALVEKVSNLTVVMFEEQAMNEGMQVSVPLSPGMLGWDVTVGQPEIFKALDTSPIGVSLTERGLMVPYKSVTTLLGMGKEIKTGGVTCDFCAMRETCNYQSHYIEKKQSMAGD